MEDGEEDEGSIANFLEVAKMDNGSSAFWKKPMINMSKLKISLIVILVWLTMCKDNLWY